MEQLNDHTISVYWWNMGRKTKEFSGSIAEYLKNKGIKYKEIPHKKDKTIKGVRYIIPVDSAKIIYEDFGYTPVSAALNAIEFMLVLLGDKTTIYSGIHSIKVNH